MHNFSFHIGSEIYNVKLVKRLSPGVLGECSFKKKEIRVLKSLPKREMMQTIIHECFHALDDEYDLRLKHKQIYKIEAALYEFIRDNF